MFMLLLQGGEFSMLNVICVCNKEFGWSVWSLFATYAIIKTLNTYGTVQTHGESLSKYAVVLLEPSQRQYIPTMYLQSDSRQFTLTDTIAIAQYALPKQSMHGNHSRLIWSGIYIQLIHHIKSSNNTSMSKIHGIINNDQWFLCGCDCCWFLIIIITIRMQVP